MDIIIEKVTTADAPELLRIYAPYVKNTAISFEYEVPSVEEVEGRIRSITRRYPYIKAIIDGKIVGYAYANEFKGRAAYDWSVETTIYIDQKYKQKGIGKALYISLENLLKTQGFLNMNACIAYIENPNEYLSNDSTTFHTKMGFKKVAHFHDSGYKFNRWFDMIWMEKIIGEHTSNPGKVFEENT